MELSVLEMYNQQQQQQQQQDFMFQNNLFHNQGNYYYSTNSNGHAAELEEEEEEESCGGGGGGGGEGVSSMETSCDGISLMITKRKAEFVEANQNQCNKEKKTVKKEVQEKVPSSKKVKENITTSSTENSADNPKSDFIHVRARRGQATDSHSLAERARREKIGKKMKCLQDLVPGCDKVTGKAGMLDEIINYVQSLQRQVDFLSMKLAVMNPPMDLNIESLCAKELPAYAASFPAAMANLPYSQLNLVEEGSTNYSPINHSQTICFSHHEELVQPFTNWDSDLQTLYHNNF
ncbi:hypothetical protein ACFE04_024205 [Oxalis oulophora]